MTPKAPLFIAFAASLSFHALAAFSFEGAPWSPGRGAGADRDVIQIAYVEPLPPAGSAPAPKKAAARVPKKAVAAAPRKTVAAVKITGVPPEVVARRKGIKSHAMPAPAAPKGVADFLADPVKGRVFANYFGLVKRRIDATVRSRYAADGPGRGTVSLSFVLNADGTLASVAVADAQTNASAQVRDFAARCVRDTAPFVAFPSELDVPRLAFNVTVLLDEL